MMDELEKGGFIKLSELSEEQLNMELEKGYQDVVSGRVRPAKDVFAAIHKDYED